MRRSAVFILCLLGVLFSPAVMAADNGQLSTHILDISKGEPAKNVSIQLSKYDDASQNWTAVSTHTTDENGRVAGLLPSGGGNDGVYKLRFETAEYFKALNQVSIYPYIEVVFRIEGNSHYHIPITLSANGYSTYRGS